MSSYINEIRAVVFKDETDLKRNPQQEIRSLVLSRITPESIRDAMCEFDIPHLTYDKYANYFSFSLRGLTLAESQKDYMVEFMKTLGFHNVERNTYFDEISFTFQIPPSQES